MPIYEYECKKCGKRVEVLQKFSDPPLAECELCRGKMSKLISQNTFHLKGTGWYVTDYASKSGGNQTSHTKSTDKTSSVDSKESKDTSKNADSKDASEKTSSSTD